MNDSEWVEGWIAVYDCRSGRVCGPERILIIDQKTRWKIKEPPSFLEGRLGSTVTKDVPSIFISTVKEAVDVMVDRWLIVELHRAEAHVREVQAQIAQRRGVL